jgi:acyl carrier protein
VSDRRAAGEISDVDEMIEDLLGEIIGIPRTRITDELAMTDVEEWDSLKHMELIVSLEESLGTQLTFDEIVAMRSVRDIKRIMNEKRAASS